MNSKIKLFPKLLMVVLILSVFGCNEEVYNIQENQKSTTKVSFEQFKNETGLKNFKTSIKINQNQNPNSSLLRNADGSYELSDFTIDTELIKRLVVEEKVTYTFRIIPKIITNENIYNLTIFKIDNVWKTSILELKPTEQNLIDLKNGTTTEFNGDVKQIYDDSQTATNAIGAKVIIVFHCHGCTGACDLCSACVHIVVFNDPFGLGTQVGPSTQGGGGTPSNNGGDNTNPGGGGNGPNDIITNNPLYSDPSGYSFDPNLPPMGTEFIRAKRATEFWDSLTSVAGGQQAWASSHPNDYVTILNNLLNNYSQANVTFSREMIDASILLDLNAMEVWDDYDNFVTQMSISEKAIFVNLPSNKKLWYMCSAKKALDKSAELFPVNSLHNGKGDAFRHALWNGLCALTIAGNVGEQLTTAHENRPSLYPFNYKETEMDLYNNNIGSQIAIISNLTNIIENILQDLNNGFLRYLNNLDQNQNNNATYNSTLIPTNQ